VFWFFDQSSGHTAFANDALNAKKMNVKLGEHNQRCGILIGVGGYKEWCIETVHQKE